MRARTTAGCLSRAQFKISCAVLTLEQAAACSEVADATSAVASVETINKVPIKMFRITEKSPNKCVITKRLRTFVSKNDNDISILGDGRSE